MDYRQLLKKYIEHVAEREGTTFLSDWERPASYSESPGFTDEEWAKLKQLEDEPLAVSAETHSCSCHPKNQGPCGICKELGCEVWDFNEYPKPLIEQYDIGVDRATIFVDNVELHGISLDPYPNAFGESIEIVGNDDPKPEKPEGDGPRAGHEIKGLM